MAVRRLPRGIVALKGESAASRLDRLASAGGLTRSAVYRAVGLRPGPVDWENNPPPGLDTTLAALAGEATQPDAFVSGIFPDGCDDTTRSWWTSRHSPACPECLAVDGAWRTAWRLPLVFGCTVHRRLLIDACPRCATATGRRVGPTPHPGVLTAVPDPTQCGNPTPGHTRVPCQQPWEEVEPGEPLGGDGLAALNRVQSALAGGDDEVGGVIVGAGEWLGAVRAVVSLLGCHGLAHELAPATIRSPGAAPDHRLARPSAPPEHPHQAATLAATAVAVLDSDRAEAIRRLAGPLQRAAATRSHGWERLSERFNAPPSLDLLIQAARPFHPTFTALLARRRPPSGLDVHHIPQVVDTAAEETAAGRFDSASRNPHRRRRFISLCLTRLVADVDWAAAADILGLTDREARPFANDQLTRCTDQHGLLEDLQLIGRRLAADGTDWAARRAALTCLDDLPADVWDEVQRGARLAPGHRGRRSRFVAVRLWTIATSGDPLLAPAMHPLKEASVHADRSYTHFIRKLSAAQLHTIDGFASELRRLTGPD